MYFNAQRARIPGLETTSHGWVSTYTLSQKAGRVTTAGSQLIPCLKKRVGSIDAKCATRKCLRIGVHSILNWPSSAV